MNNMDEYINVNLNTLFNEDKKLLTERGWIKPSEILDGDRIVAVSGENSWYEINKKKNEKKIQTLNFFG